MSHAKNKVDWCLQKAKKELQEGKKQRGLIKTVTNKEKAREHISKADHRRIIIQTSLPPSSPIY